MRDVRDVLLGLGYDKRIGFEFLRPGPGLGRVVLAQGHAGAAPHRRESGYDFSLLAGAIASNEEQLARGSSPRLEAACGGSVDQVTIAAWGLTFKANTDDRRDSPSLQMACRLVSSGATVRAFDPTVDPSADRPRTLSVSHLCGDPYEAATGAQALVVLTEWDVFRWLDFGRVLRSWRSPASWTRATCSTRRPFGALGFRYTGIGRR